MTRRILGALLGLTVALLAGVVVPLGITSADHDQQVFTDRTIAGAAALAAAAEERLADHEQGIPTPSAPSVPPALVDRDATAVYDSTGTLFQHSASAVPVRPADVTSALAGHTVRRWLEQPRDALLVLRPAYSGVRIVGVAAVLRDADPLIEQTTHLWLGLGLAGIAAVLLAGGLSVALARWVGRPLRRLDTAADRLGSGDLTVRASMQGGPPEVHQLAVTFNDMAARLEALVGGHRSLVADISHQLRTPLAAMRLRLELLHDDVDSTAANELTGALGEIARLSRLVDGLLALARAEHTQPAPITIDLVPLVEERVATWSPLVQERHIALRTALGPGRVAATPGHLEQALDNLLANALDATPDGGHITISIHEQRDRVRLEVIDSGPGMTEAQRAHAFHRFWTNPLDHPSSEDAGGSGLGLAIAHRLITVDGGTITLTNMPSRGLAVQIDLHPAN